MGKFKRPLCTESVNDRWVNRKLDKYHVGRGPVSI